MTETLRPSFSFDLKQDNDTVRLEWMGYVQRVYQPGDDGVVGSRRQGPGPGGNRRKESTESRFSGRRGGQR